MRHLAFATLMLVSPALAQAADITVFSPGIAKLTTALPEVLRGRELALFEQRREEDRKSVV